MSATVDRAARDLIEQHGTRAAYIAVERLNQSIDKRDVPDRDFWAQVVHAIHEHQRLVDAHKARSGRSRQSRSPQGEREIATTGEKAAALKNSGKLSSTVQRVKP
jgi:hypothetical protein